MGLSSRAIAIRGFCCGVSMRRAVGGPLLRGMGVMSLSEGCGESQTCASGMFVGGWDS